jgi:hypothetical protein
MEDSTNVNEFEIQWQNGDRSVVKRLEILHQVKIKKTVWGGPSYVQNYQNKYMARKTGRKYNVNRGM